MKHYKKILLLLVLVSPFTVGGDVINTTYFGRLAIEGFDSVAYFTEDKALKGNRKFTYSWQGANWRFFSRENLELFKANPEKYTPQYGGYCAYAVGAKNTTASIDPTQYTIVDGKLYLNYNVKIQKKWHEKQAEYIVSADKNWPKILVQLKND